MMRSIALALVSLGLGVLAPAGISSASAQEPSGPSYTLREVLTFALERNPNLAFADGFVDQQEGERVKAGAYPNPSVSAIAGRGVVLDSLVGPNGPYVSERFIGFNQPIEWPLRRFARKEAASAKVASAKAVEEETRLNLIANVKLAFYDLLLAQRQEEIARDNLQTIERVARAVGFRVETGDAPPFEAIKANVEVLQANQQLTRAQNAVRIRRTALDALTAGALGRTYEVHGEFRRHPGTIEMEQVTTQALEQHPTIRKLKNSVASAQHQVQFEQQSVIPMVTVSGNYARDAGREGILGGLSIPTPLWYQRQGHIAAALGAKRQEEAALLRARFQLLKETNQFFQDAETEAEQIRVFEDGLLTQSEETLRIAQISFRYGEANLLQVLDAQRTAREIFLQFAQSRYRLSTALTRLERALGVSLADNGGGS